MEEVQPLSSLKELMEWSMPCLTSNIHRERLRARPPSSHLRTLVCHDMKGGYLDDRFVSGTSNKDAYRFYHWSGVDTFIYFSHHLVTIPPLGWINAAHLHGVPVLGTFITEWEAGSAVCKDLLNDVKTVTQVVQKLVNIAKYYGFDGWLINIENEVPIDKVPLMLMFVEKLTVAMRNVRYDKNCHHRVIWYDSVTKNGELKWQNELNSQNYAFFFACDGIFLNYTWTEDHLVRSRKAAGSRHRNIFVGLDVFGRNFYAGGKYDTWKAMEVVRKHDLSAAIFAPGWTYETQPDFIEAERRLWESLSPFLTHQGIEDLPFTTSFCQGFGEHLFIKGKVEKEGPWHNLSQQHLQPLWSQEGEEEGSCRLSLVTQEAYNGGGCLGITTHSPTTVRFMLCNLECNQLLRVTVAYKWSSQPTTLAFLCQLSPNDTSLQQRSSPWWLCCCISPSHTIFMLRLNNAARCICA
ncbi:cytosolic endo-beta-N-acetylglucosaminidase-like isoform X2 [Portunus trituberculatus]|uniref:cytosolic endo-beta-N-acetylglucosaminidase-like isoform X2 n=1 Tax=Portunus trituberculatus TaxID=210409 RepID=UPI001E1CBE74|nr:cytosolic endo-beta-N-acetylglucosaminidase-like isoform X2 [Portunus trituberculatus]